jgi:hypothetical protein
VGIAHSGRSLSRTARPFDGDAADQHGVIRSSSSVDWFAGVERIVVFDATIGEMAANGLCFLLLDAAFMTPQVRP